MFVEKSISTGNGIEPTADGPAANGLLQALRRMGASIAIDDFGVGYSSLTLLRRLPISALKIDRSFVAELATNHQDAAIVEAILRMAHSVGLRTVAEGVEHDGQDAVLGDLGCQEGQGYLFARPLDVAAATVWLAANAAGRRAAMTFDETGEAMRLQAGA